MACIGMKRKAGERLLLLLLLGLTAISVSVVAEDPTSVDVQASGVLEVGNSMGITQQATDTKHDASPVVVTRASGARLAEKDAIEDHRIVWWKPLVAAASVLAAAAIVGVGIVWGLKAGYKKSQSIRTLQLQEMQREASQRRITPGRGVSTRIALPTSP